VLCGAGLVVLDRNLRLTPFTPLVLRWPIVLGLARMTRARGQAPPVQCEFNKCNTSWSKHVGHSATICRKLPHMAHVTQRQTASPSSCSGGSCSCCPCSCYTCVCPSSICECGRQGQRCLDCRSGVHFQCTVCGVVVSSDAITAKVGLRTC